MNKSYFQKGHLVPQEWRKAVSESRKGNTPWNKGTKGVMNAWNKGIKTGIKHSKQFKKGMIPWNKGIGNKTSISKRMRTSPAFKKWREQVFERDDYTCQECGNRGSKLHPHHIKRMSEYPEFCYLVSNGQTLCASCHIKTPTYGNRH